MYLCLYVYIHNTLACYLNLYPNYTTVIIFITHLILHQTVILMQFLHTFLLILFS